MDCQECIQNLSAYLDQELAPMPRTEADQHLQRCPPCRRLVQTCQQTIQTYRSQPAPELPAALHRQVMDGVNRAVAK